MVGGSIRLPREDRMRLAQDDTRAGYRATRQFLAWGIDQQCQLAQDNSEECNALLEDTGLWSGNAKP